MNKNGKNETTKYSKWLGITFGIIAGVFLTLIAYVCIVDPFFHYHKPVSYLNYAMNNERYQNDGIERHWNYDTVITGTSLTENFKASDCDEIFGGTSIKVSLRGATFREVNDNLERAFNYNKNIKNVIRCLDVKNFYYDKDYISYEGLPDYLYDNNIFNDVRYVLNKSVIMAANEQVMRTLKGEPADTFDTYMYWADEYVYGREKVLSTFSRPEMKQSEIQPDEIQKSEPQLNETQQKEIQQKEIQQNESKQIEIQNNTVQNALSDEEKQTILGNIRVNITQTASKHPETSFYYYLSPDSICWWDAEVVRQGEFDRTIEMMELAISEIVKTPNIRLYSFTDDFDLITNLDHYKDVSHYDAQTNHDILVWMKEGKGLLTEDNYREYIEKIRDFYSEYNYDQIYE